MARTREEIVKAGIAQGLSNAEIMALVKSEAAAPAAPVSEAAASVSEATAPAKPVRAAAPPRPAAPRPAAPRPVAQAPMVSMAAPRVTAPVQAEPAMEAMVTPVRPIAAPAPEPVVAPAVPDARLKAEEEIQLKRMLDEQRAFREQQNVQWTQQALEPLQTLFGPGLVAAPMTGPAAPLVAAGSLGLAALAPVAGAAASGLSKLGAYGGVEATPAMREEARRRAQAAVRRQQFVAEEPNLGETLLTAAGQAVEGLTRPYSNLLEGVKAIPEALRPAYQKYEQMAAGGRGKVLTPKVGPQTPEELALYKGGQFAENLKRVQSAPDQLIAVGPRAPSGRTTGREYEQIVSPKVAAISYRNEFDAWAKRFPEQAKTVLAEVAKESEARRTSTKLAAGNVPSAAALEVPQAEQERLAQVAAMGKEQMIELPLAEDLGVSQSQLLTAFRKAGITGADVRAGVVPESTMQRLRGALTSP
jgi:hypothetical protein